MIKPSDLTCRHCVYSAPLTVTDYDGCVHIWCRLGPYPNKVEDEYWCKQGYWIIRKYKGNMNHELKQTYAREDLFIAHVTGEIIDPWKA